MTSISYIVHGPTACGKTRHKEAIRAALECDRVVDDVNLEGRRNNRRVRGPDGPLSGPLLPGTVYLTRESATACHEIKRTLGFGDVSVLAFDDVMGLVAAART